MKIDNPSNHILIVDDDPDVCASLENICKLKGYSADAALNSDDAIQLCKKKTYSLALVAINPGDKPGYEVAELIAASSPELEIIYLAEQATLGTAMKAVKEKEVVGYELKPIEPEHP